jgi:hypothetical protein
MTVIKNGSTSSVNMDVAPIIRDGRTCMPIRFVAEAFGLKVEWLGDYTADDGNGIVYCGRVAISEGIKTLNFLIGKKEQTVFDGYFLKFYESDDFRFAYPLYPECINLSEGNIISFYSEPWIGLPHTITVIYTPVEGTPFADKDLDSTVSKLNTQGMTLINEERINYNGIPTVAYSLAPPDRKGDVRGVYGVAFYNDDMLMRFEVGFVCKNYEVSEGTISNEVAIGSAKYLLEELLPTMTFKQASGVNLTAAVQDVYAEFLRENIRTDRIDIDAFPEGSEEHARLGAFMAGGYPTVPFFYIHDIDKNGTPELILIDPIHDYNGDVYTFKENSIAKLGSIKFYPFGDLGNPLDKQNGLYSDVGYKGHYGEVLYYTIENGIIVSKLALEYNNQPDVSPDRAGALYSYDNFDRLDYYEVTEKNIEAISRVRSNVF